MYLTLIPRFRTVFFLTKKFIGGLVVRPFIAVCALTVLTACGGSSSSGGEAASSSVLEDGAESDNTGLFEIDRTISNLGGATPANTLVTDASDSTDYLAGLQFVDGKGVGIEFLHESKSVLRALDIKTGIAIDGFDSSMLASDGFTSVVYPDDFDGDRLVEITSSTASRLIVYWPDENVYEVIPGSRNENNALEVVLPELYKQTFFALMQEGALGK